MRTHKSCSQIIRDVNHEQKFLIISKISFTKQQKNFSFTLWHCLLFFDLVDDGDDRNNEQRRKKGKKENEKKKPLKMWELGGDDNYKKKRKNLS